MSAETREHIQFCCVALHQITCNSVSQGETALPYRLNTGVVENFFCCQSTRNNGACSNPTYLQYAKGMNTLVLASKNKKAATKPTVGSNSAVPFNYTFKKALCKWQKIHIKLPRYIHHATLK